MIIKMVTPRALHEEYWHEMLIECDRFEIQHQKEWSNAYYSVNEWTFFGTEEPDPVGRPYFQMLTWLNGTLTHFAAFNTNIYIMNDKGETVDKYIGV